MHCRTTRYRVYSQNQHISVDGEFSFTVYKKNQLTPKCCRHICTNIFLFLLLNLYIDSSVCSLCIFPAPVLLRSPPRWQPLYCIVTYLPWYFLDWRFDRVATRHSHCDLSADPDRCLLIPPAMLSCPPPDPRPLPGPLHFLSSSSPCLCCMVSAFWMLATNILKVFVWFVTFYCRRSPRDNVCWFSTKALTFHIYWMWISIKGDCI